MAKLSGSRKSSSRRRTRRSRRSRRSSTPPTSLSRRSRRGSSRRRGGRRSSKGFSLKQQTKDAAMFGLVGAGLTYVAMRAGSQSVGGTPLITKIASYTKGNTNYAAAILFAALGLGAGYLLRRKSPKLARNLTLAGVGLGVITAVSEAVNPAGTATTIQPQMAGLVSATPAALPMDTGVDGLELDGLSLDNDPAEYGNVPVSGF